MQQLQHELKVKEDAVLSMQKVNLGMQKELQAATEVTKQLQ